MRKLFFTLLLSLMTLSSNAQMMKLGDLNQDNQVNVVDVTALVDIILNGYSSFSVSPEEVTMLIGETADVTISGGYDIYEVETANPDIVTASLNGSTVTLTAVSAGETTITVKDVLTFRTIDIPIVVNSQPQSYLTCPDDHHPHLIDLGLPSGTKWACCNVADDPKKQSPTNYGGYYAWGETEEKSVYSDVTYLYAKGVDENGDGWFDDYYSDTDTWGVWQNLGSDIAGTQYDVAHVKWGSSWVMPSLDQQDELQKYTSRVWITVNGVNVVKYTSHINSGIILLPQAGFIQRSDIIDAGNSGYYWTSTQGSSDLDCAYTLHFYPDFLTWYSLYRSIGYSVRPVFR